MDSGPLLRDAWDMGNSRSHPLRNEEVSGPGPTPLSRSRGCLLGGAVGDALGAPVEFMRLHEIQAAFGPGGIRDFVKCYGRIGAITDDTQMSLFTAEGLLQAQATGSERGGLDVSAAVHHGYLQWLRTQGEESRVPDLRLDGRLLKRKELFSRRAPGNTCLSALRAATCIGQRASNDSKGCGTVMRAAPVGLFAAALEQGADKAFEWGCQTAALTHGHPTGILAAGVFAALIHQLAGGSSLSPALRVVKAMLPRRPGCTETFRAIEAAEELDSSSHSADDCLKRLGQGWVAEEALAVAVFCALRAKDFEDGVATAVNIDGDSDSTGSMAGNLLGAMLGVESIPPRWLEPLELREVITELADELCAAGRWHLPAGESPAEAGK